MTRPAPVADLARERRIAAAVDKLRAHLEAHPEVAERTHAYLAGELSGPSLEVNMPGSVTISIRAPEDLVERAEALRPVLSRTDLGAVGTAGAAISRGAVLRLALARGLFVLEAEHGAVAPLARRCGREAFAAAEPGDQHTGGGKPLPSDLDRLRNLVGRQPDSIAEAAFTAAWREGWDAAAGEAGGRAMEAEHGRKAKGGAHAHARR